MGNITYTWEPSGGLLNASLVMMDRETDSYWSIIKEESVWGEAEGTPMEILPGAAKTTWGEWRALHPASLVMSIDGKQHNPENPYVDYFKSEDGFRKIKAADAQMPDKAQIYAFHWGEEHFAVPHASYFDGGVVQVGDREIFLYRAADDSGYRSTSAYIAPPGAKFVKNNGGWEVGAARWNGDQRRFDGEGVEVFSGFDTFWYTWSLTNAGTKVLTAG